MLAKTLLNTDERLQACKLFWSIYVLDRRWSFGTGMPFAIQDADIDPALPEPVRALLHFAAGCHETDGLRTLQLRT